jgi:glycosyltransferase involved in cell wall biosynthesis
LSEPLVSVVVPTYQSEPYVAEALESVLSQTYPYLEVVVGDHSSTDRTWEIVNRYAADPRVRVVRTTAGGGAARNWNRVTDEARGEYVKLLCADDILRTTCVEEQVRAAERYPDVVMVASKRDLIDARGARLVRGRGLAGLDGVVPGYVAIRRTVRSGTNIFGEPACVLFRTETVREVGGWAADQAYLIDEELYVRVLQRGSLYAISRPLAAFRVSQSQWSISLARNQALQAASLHSRLRLDCPEIVSGFDEWLGSRRATVMAWKRRIAYLVWTRRMRPDAR